MKIGQYSQRQRCRHVELEQFWQAFASRGFVSDSWAFLFSTLLTLFCTEHSVITVDELYVSATVLMISDDDECKLIIILFTSVTFISLLSVLSHGYDSNV